MGALNNADFKTEDLIDIVKGTLEIDFQFGHFFNVLDNEILFRDKTTIYTSHPEKYIINKLVEHNLITKVLDCVLVNKELILDEAPKYNGAHTLIIKAFKDMPEFDGYKRIRAINLIKIK